MVQGGYNAVLAAPDTLDAHFLDTLAGGGWINDQELVWTLVTEAPGRVRELENRYGCFFDRHPDGRIHQKPFAGQSHDRTIHKGDLTGIEIMNRLTEQVWTRPSIRALEEHRAVELLRDGAGRAGGALLLDIRRGGFLAVRARATLLALRDMEMVQFHPTGLVVPNSLMTGALLEEGLRGAGGRLLNGTGERFMGRYDPTRMERSTRDLVARACFTEVQEGRGSPNGGVWIDVSHLGAKTVEANFRGMVRRCRDFGRDLAREPVEVGPTAHFMMGGVVIDPSCRTSVEGLFAAGEDTGGIHGANRLGGNGVADSTVFGGLAGDVMADWVVGRGLPRLSVEGLEAVTGRLVAPLDRGEGENLYKLQQQLRDVMWEHVGLIRSAAGLKSALKEIEEIGQRAAGAPVPGGPTYNLAWQDWLNLQSQAAAAWLIARSALERNESRALERNESRGSHYRSDYPVPGSELYSVSVGADDSSGLRVWTEPVKLTRLSPSGIRQPAGVDVGD